MMGHFKIEKNIPVAKHPNLGKEKYPISQMEVGDSFLIAAKTPEEIRLARCRIAPRIYTENARGVKRFITRTVDNGLRVWRVK